MPVMDGITSTLRIREFEASQGSKRTPIFALSAIVSPSSIEEALASGIDQYLTKPVKLAQLSTILKDLE